jgi:hypothetical protein
MLIFHSLANSSAPSLIRLSNNAPGSFKPALGAQTTVGIYCNSHAKLAIAARRHAKVCLDGKLHFILSASLFFAQRGFHVIFGSGWTNGKK